MDAIELLLSKRLSMLLFLPPSSICDCFLEKSNPKNINNWYFRVREVSLCLIEILVLFSIWYLLIKSANNPSLRKLMNYCQFEYLVVSNGESLMRYKVLFVCFSNVNFIFVLRILMHSILTLLLIPKFLGLFLKAWWKPKQFVECWVPFLSYAECW